MDGGKASTATGRGDVGGGGISVFVHFSVSVSGLNLTLHLNNLTEGVSSKGPEPATRNNSQAKLWMSAVPPRPHPPPHPPSLVNQTHLRQSVSDTSGGRKSNLPDGDVDSIGFTLAITTRIKANHWLGPYRKPLQQTPHPSR